MASTSSSKRARRPSILVPATRPATYRSAVEASADYGASAEPDWRDIDWREHAHDLTLAGRRVRYVDIGAGDGPPVLFVHGLGGAWQNWLENLPRVALERRALALDLPGFGDSEMPEDAITIPHFTRVVEEFCAALDLGRIDLVGNSMGGFIAADLAIQHAERVERLVLVSAAGLSIADIRREPALTIAKLWTALGALNAARLRALVRRPRSRHLAFNSIMRHPTRLATDLLFEQAGGAGKPGFILALDALTRYDFRDRLADIRAPTLIVQGEEDMLVPAADGREYERLIPDSRLRIFEDTGHTTMLERPRAFNDLLMEFLDEGTAGLEPRNEADAAVDAAADESSDAAGDRRAQAVADAAAADPA